jgi:copper homeostasis protein
MTEPRVTPKILCEVCIDSVEGARAAELGGADRVELCANLVEGGTTPSTGMIRAVLEACSLPVMVMIRPRGGHFTFTPDEVEVMCLEAEAVLSEPIAGIVIGALHADGSVDRATCEKLIELAVGRSVTFHRAFDQVRNPDTALEALVELRIDRVLTSGQAISAEQGLDQLTRLNARAARRISIMPGCGVRAANARRIVEASGATELHFSASQLVQCPVSFWRTEVPMSAPTTPGDLHRRTPSLQEVEAICQAVRVSE